MNDEKLQNFKNTFSYKLIYIFTICDDIHKGCLKIGDTTLNTDLQPDKLNPNCSELKRVANERIKTYTNTAAVPVELLYTELAFIIRQENGKIKTEFFRDYNVHRVLKNSGIKNKKFEESTGSQWYEISLETAKEAITAVKNHLTSLDKTKRAEDFVPIVFRPEQKEAITKTIVQFKKSSRMLWNAKMRFGKTLCALEVVKKCNFKRTILITHRPVVDESWHEDFYKIFTKEDNFIYGSKKNNSTIKKLEKSEKNYIYFSSIQDLRGSKEAGGKFDKNDDVFNVNWNLVIIDEAHEGTTTKLGDEVKSLLFKEKNGTKLLELSGTPFNILENYDDKNSVYTWDYVMEQKAKLEWEKTHFGDSNPYSDLPQMNMFTYELGKLLDVNYADFNDKAFNFSEFFKINEAGTFVHESDVKSFLNLLTKENKESFYPFCCDEYRKLFHHSLWIIPGVKEALALQHLLESHPIFQTFKIVNVAGNGNPDDPTGEPLFAVKKAIEDADEDGYTITLSCGKLTTGVSIPEWTAVFMLSGSYSTKASGYLQTIFRVQTPCKKYGKIKTQAYVFDFAPDRTLKMVADAVTLSAKSGKTKIDDKLRLGEFLNFCPVIGIEGSKMKSYEVNGLLQQLKSAYAERAVTKGFDDTSIYNDELLKLSSVELKKFKDLQAIMGETKANNAGEKIDVNTQGLTEEEYESLDNQKPQNEKRILTPEEEKFREKLLEAKKMRQTAISILRGISIRMPLLIYGADVSVSEEINLEKFIELVDDTSWKEFMPRGITKEKFREFIKYYDEDVFIAAGKRIRNLVLNAERLDVSERVKKISEIFSYFRNPDKETVLTPWRVVNMHLGECLGGYSFFDFNYEDPLYDNEEPRFINIPNVTDKTLANPNAKILEINSKTGLYPLYCAYSIFRAKKAKLAVNGKNSSVVEQSNVAVERNIAVVGKNIAVVESGETTTEACYSERSEESLWNETIEQNIFVICKTPMAKSITQRTLSGYGNVKINAHYFEDLVNQLKNKNENFISKIKSKNYWKKGNGTMEFDAIVGNPPYQSETGGSGRQATPVYNLFFNASKKLNANFISMIMPSRWFSGGFGLDDFREQMLNDERIRLIVDYPKSTDVFPSVDIAGGVCYLLWNKNDKGTCKVINVEKGISHSSNRKLNEYKTFVRYSQALPIIRKVFKIENPKQTLENTVSQQRPFGLPTNYLPKEKGIPCYFIQKIGKKFASQKDIVDSSNLLRKWKLLVPKAPIAGQTDFTKPVGFYYDGNTRIAEPGSCCTESFIVAGAFDTEKEVLSFKSYLFTKTVRFLLLQTVISQDVLRNKFCFVPALEKYEGKYTDEILCKRWKITESEWNYINSRIHNYEK